jgi:hypothetical protein
MTYAYPYAVASYSHTYRKEPAPSYPAALQRMAVKIWKAGEMLAGTGAICYNGTRKLE